MPRARCSRTYLRQSMELFPSALMELRSKRLLRVIGVTDIILSTPKVRYARRLDEGQTPILVLQEL